MKRTLTLILLALTLLGCAKSELPEPNQPESITFKVIGLYSHVPKHITILCGPYRLDTVVQGQFIYRVQVTQSIMHSVMTVRTITPISETLIIEAQGTQSANWNSCEWLEYDIRETYKY